MFFACTFAFANVDCSPVESKNIKTSRNHIRENKIEEIYGNIRNVDIGLPASLITIEDEAFEGTAITTIVLPKSVKKIGDYAFANIQSLRKIEIPNTTMHIGENAFKGSNDVIVSGAPKSYARTWAYANGVPFHPITSFYAYEKTFHISGVLHEKRLSLDNKTEDKPELHKGRITRELVVDKCNSIFAFHVQGRAPPICKI